MMWLETLAQPVWRNLVFALLHTLWQGALLGLLLYLGLRWIPARRHNARYLLAFGLQVGLLVAGLATWGILNLGETRDQPVSRAGQESSPLAPQVDQGPAERVDAGWASSTAAPQPNIEPAASPANWVPWAAALWALGVAFMLLRTVVSVIQARRLARGPAVTDAALLETMNELRRELRIGRRVRAVVCEACGSPAVLGIVWPTVVLPVSMLTGLSPESARAILAHELAHIRRHDYLLNLAQMLIEAVLFFNPAVWWMSRQVRNEREACCDALAVATTGEPIGYARALADWAERVPTGASPAAAAAWTGPGEKTLLDRVRRVLLPGYRPDVQVSWSGLIGLVVLGPLVLAGMWQGTTAAVALAAEILSPQERIQALEQAREEYAPPLPRTGKLTLRGTVRTADGEPVPHDTWGHYATERRGGSNMGTIGRFGEQFTAEVPHGITWLTVAAEGYAPKIAGPFSSKQGETIGRIEIILERGFPTRIQVLDERGQPAAGAQVSGAPVVNQSTSAGHNGTTEKNGIVVFEHTSDDRPYQFTVRGPGYQEVRSGGIKLQPDKTVTLRVQRARPTTGVVVTPEGDPVAGAEIKEFAEFVPGSSRTHGSWGSVLATTDERGRFTLDTLEDGGEYALLVETEEHGRAIAEGIMAGQENVRIKVGPNRKIEGTITGDLQKLAKSQGEPVVSYGQTVGFQRSRNSRTATTVNGRAVVEPTEDGGRFTIDGLLTGEASVTAGEHSVRVDMDTPVQRMTIDLTAPPAKPPTREVVLRFVTPDGDVHPQGDVQLHITGERDEARAQQKILPLQNGELRFDAYVPGRVNYSPESVIGYWFDGGSLEIQPAYEPLRVEIPTIPAGAIVGQVLNPDGTPATAGVSIGIRTIEKPPQWGNKSLSIAPTGVDIDSDGQFFISPVPFGGTYVVVAGRQHNRQPSQPLHLSRPTQRITIRLGPTRDITGQVLGPDGRSLEAIPVSLELSHPEAGTSWGPPKLTDRHGRFEFRELSSELAGYQVEIDSKRDYQPVAVPVPVSDKPMVIRLQNGHVVEGRVVDSETGWPIPGVEMYAYRMHFQPGERYAYDAEDVTDDEGRFRFSNLPDEELRLNDRSGLQWQSPTGREVRAGQSEPVLIRATLPEWSKLKPVRPEAP